MRKIGILVLVAWTTSIFAPSAAWAQDTATLEQRLQALEQEVQLLRRQLEVKDEETAKKVSETAIVTASPKEGFVIKSQDGDFKLRVRGYAQVDGRFFEGTKKDLGRTDTFVPRRIRPIFEGTVFRDYDFLITPDFGNSTVLLQDGYVEYKHWPEAKLRVGKFKEPFGLERLQSDVNTSFIETGLPTLLTPNRDVGVQLSGDFNQGWLTYQVGVFNGVADSVSAPPDADTNLGKDIAARIFVRPFKDFEFAPLRGLGAGVAGTFGHEDGTTLPTIKSTGQTTVFSYSTGVISDGPHNRFSPQLYYYYDQFGLIAEYVDSTQGVTRTTGGTKQKLDDHAWQVSGVYVLTGEDASYNGVTPRHPFDLSRGTWGAFQVAARYGELDVDQKTFDLGFASRSASVAGIQEWALGLNWYPNTSLKLALDYARSTFQGGGPNEDLKSENAILTRAQVQF